MLKKIPQSFSRGTQRLNVQERVRFASSLAARVLEGHFEYLA
jgi:hypothetical protein